jgi:hypothetical protein
MKISEIYKKEYVGNCVNSFDEDGECLIGIYDDVSDFANSEENSKEISNKDFINLVGEIPKYLKNKIKNHELSYLYDEDNDIAMIYDITKDIHYFFK